MEAELMCGVCLEYFDKPLMLPCTHNFCKKCIEGILSVNSRPQMSAFSGIGQQRQRKYHLDCPLCQRSIDLERGVESLTVNRILENIIALHRKDEPLASNDTAWKLDSSTPDSPCLMHNSEPLSLYCLTCNRAVCKLCDCVTNKTSGTSHKCVPVKEQADLYQMKISNAIAEIKRKVVPIQDEIQLLQDMMEQIKSNEESIKSQLDTQISGLIQSLKSRQEELMRQLHNDIVTIKRPIEEQLRRHVQLKKTVDDHLKRLNSIKITKDTGLRIKLMKESERQLNSLLCFDMPMFSSKDMPIVDMPVWEVDKDSVLQSIQQLQWKKSGGSNPDEIFSRPPSMQSSRQSSKEDDVVSSPRTPPVSFEPSPSVTSFSDKTVTRSTMTKRQKPRNPELGNRKDLDNIQPNIIAPNIQPNIPTVKNITTTTYQQSTVSSSQPTFSNVAMSTIFRISTQPSSVATNSNFVSNMAGSKSNITTVTSENSRPAVNISNSSSGSWFSSTIVPSTQSGDQTLTSPLPCTTQLSQVVSSTSVSQFSNVQPKTNTISVTVPKAMCMPQGQISRPSTSSESSNMDTASDVVEGVSNSSKQVNFPIPSTSDFMPQSGSSSSSTGTNTVNFPIPSSSDFVPQSGSSSSVSTSTNTVISQNRGLLRKPKSEYGNKNEINTSTLMAMVTDQGDIGMDTVIRSMETVRLGVRDDSNIPVNGNNIPRTNTSNIRVDRRASTGNAHLPTQSNISFRGANLPTISATDFLPTHQRRSGSPSVGARTTLKPKKKISK